MIRNLSRLPIVLEESGDGIGYIELMAVKLENELIDTSNWCKKKKLY